MTTSNDLFNSAAMDYGLIARANPYYGDFQDAAAKTVGACATKMEATGKPLKLLEIGCGTGYTTAAVLRAIPQVDFNLRAIDLQPGYIAAAKERIVSPQVEFVAANALKEMQATRSKSVDVLFSAYIIHNLDCVTRKSYYDEISRVLVPGGYFVNADKYRDPCMDEDQHQKLLGEKFANYADFFLKIGRYDLLRDVLAHYLHDDLPFMRLHVNPLRSDLDIRGLHDMQCTATFGLDKVLSWQKE